MGGASGQEVRIEDAYPYAMPCIRRSDPSDQALLRGMSCISLKELSEGRTPKAKGLLIASTEDLTKRGLDILIHDGGRVPLAAKVGARHEQILPGALCVGLRFGDMEIYLQEVRVSVFLDDPPRP